MSNPSKIARLAEQAIQRSLSQREGPGSKLTSAPKKVSLEPVRLEKVLHYWGDDVRGVPNILLRSALFGSSRSTSQIHLMRAEIYAQKPACMGYIGSRLDQGDLDVMMTLLHLSRQKILGRPFKTSAYELLELQGKTDAGNNIKTLHKRLSRLASGRLELGATRQFYNGCLVYPIEKNDIERKLVIKLNPELFKLFGPDDFTYIDWPLRRSLNAKPLAQWLHGYYSTHAKAFRMSVEKLMRMAGSLDASASSQEQNIRRALDALKRSSDLYGQPFSYEISGGYVDVSRTPSSSQSRHLARKNNGSESKKNYRTFG